MRQPGQCSETLARKKEKGERWKERREGRKGGMKGKKQRKKGKEEGRKDQVWWHRPVIPELRRLRQTTLGYMASSRPA
jgi:hypothetical protein